MPEEKRPGGQHPEEGNEEVMQIGIGIVILVVTIGALLYIFYSRMNSVQKTGYTAFLILGVGAVIVPLIWIANNQAQAQSQQTQYLQNLNRGAAVFGTYCSQCHGFLGQGVSAPPLNGSKAVAALTDDDLRRIISAGIPASTSGTSQLAKFQMAPFSETYGGSLTDDDITYVMMLIRSSDPSYLAKNHLPTNINGFTPDANGYNLIYYQLTTAAAQQQYIQQRNALAFHVGPLKDFTNTKSVSMDIVNEAATAAVPWGFQYNNIKIKVGTTVTWTNVSSAPHTVTSGVGGTPDGVFNSSPGGANPLLPNNQGKSSVFSFTFTKAGTFKYFCSIHPSMMGEVTVVQ
jgi:plastocyanin/mono/diheme cytochrome c family protein